MPRAAVAAALLLVAAAPAAAQVPLFPGDRAQPPAFPTALSVWGLAGFGGQRATRRFIDLADPDCDTIPCKSEHRLTGSLGVGARFQTGLSPRMGLRFGVSFSAPSQKARLTEPTRQTRVGDKLSAARGEVLLLMRLKPQVPVYFGLGIALARFSPGPVFGQDGATEVGAALAVGFDHRINPRVGTRTEWTTYLMRPSGDVFSTEYRPTALAFDHQVSFGVSFFLNP